MQFTQNKLNIDLVYNRLRLTSEKRLKKLQIANLCHAFFGHC